MRTVIFPGTFDPITLGHIDLISRASRLFDRVIVAIAYSERKSPLFSFEERKALVDESLKGITNIESIGFTGLIIELAKAHHADAVLRGVRNSTDFDYELQMADMNQKLYPAFETVFLSPANQYCYISSTLVREIASMQGDVSQLVSPPVHTALLKKFA
ncbi:MAG: pantetheine-phosphate adenylyltransferase [Pseudomonadales bacterium]|nr:pantetheine-phosphate adenylyltransferase [Pseudomonadales bacterium]